MLAGAVHDRRRHRQEKAPSVRLDPLGTETGAQAQTKTVDGKTYTLSWSDEFNGTSVESSKWFITSEANYYGAYGYGFDPTKAKPYVKDGALYLPIRLINGRWYQSGIRGHDEKH